MNELLMLGAIIAGLWAVLLWQRVPAALLFLSVLIGHLLATEVNSDAYGLALASGRLDDPSLVQIGLLLAPVVLSIVFLRHKVPRSKIAVEAIPMLFTAATLLLLAVPLIPSLQQSLESALSELSTYRSIILACACVSVLITTLFMSRAGGHHGKRHD